MPLPAIHGRASGGRRLRGRRPTDAGKAMSPKVAAAFADILRKRFYPSRSCSVLEVGASTSTLLSIPLLRDARKVALNLQFANPAALSRTAELIVGNGNALGFSDETFDCVMSCSAMEHDAYFWKTAAETRRVLKKRGAVRRRRSDLSHVTNRLSIYDIDLCKARAGVQR